MIIYFYSYWKLLNWCLNFSNWMPYEAWGDRFYLENNNKKNCLAGPSINDVRHLLLYPPTRVAFIAYVVPYHDPSNPSPQWRDVIYERPLFWNSAILIFLFNNNSFFTNKCDTLVNNISLLRKENLLCLHKFNFWTSSTIWIAAI